MHYCHERDHHVQEGVDTQHQDASPAIIVGSQGIVGRVLKDRCIDRDHQGEQLREEGEHVVIRREEGPSDPHIEEEDALEGGDHDGLHPWGVNEDGHRDDLPEPLPGEDCVVHQTRRVAGELGQQGPVH